MGVKVTVRDRLADKPYRVSVLDSTDGSPRLATVVAVSGLGGRASGWAAVAEHLPGWVRLVVYDRARLGASDPLPSPEERDMSHFSDEISQVMDHLDIRRAFLLGHSFGGLIAAHFLTTRPKRALGGVLLDPTPPPFFNHGTDGSAEGATRIDQSAIYEQFMALSPTPKPVAVVSKGRRKWLAVPEQGVSRDAWSKLDRSWPRGQRALARKLGAIRIATRLGHRMHDDIYRNTGDICPHGSGEPCGSCLATWLADASRWVGGNSSFVAAMAVAGLRSAAWGNGFEVPAEILPPVGGRVFVPDVPRPGVAGRVASARTVPIWDRLARNRGQIQPRVDDSQIPGSIHMESRPSPSITVPTRSIQRGAPAPGKRLRIVPLHPMSPSPPAGGGHPPERQRTSRTRSR